jgi:hypothetical protein
MMERVAGEGETERKKSVESILGRTPTPPIDQTSMFGRAHAADCCGTKVGILKMRFLLASKSSMGDVWGLTL